MVRIPVKPISDSAGCRSGIGAERRWWVYDFRGDRHGSRGKVIIISFLLVFGRLGPELPAQSLRDQLAM